MGWYREEGRTRNRTNKRKTEEGVRNDRGERGKVWRGEGKKSNYKRIKGRGGNKKKS